MWSWRLDGTRARATPPASATAANDPAAEVVREDHTPPVAGPPQGDAVVEAVGMADQRDMGGGGIPVLLARLDVDPLGREADVVGVGIRQLGELLGRHPPPALRVEGV